MPSGLGQIPPSAGAGPDGPDPERYPAMPSGLGARPAEPAPGQAEPAHPDPARPAATLAGLGAASNLAGAHPDPAHADPNAAGADPSSAGADPDAAGGSGKFAGLGAAAQDSPPSGLGLRPAAERGAARTVTPAPPAAESGPATPAAKPGPAAPAAKPGRVKRPPLEAPQMGQLNKPLTAPDP